MQKNSPVRGALEGTAIAIAVVLLLGLSWVAIAHAAASQDDCVLDGSYCSIDSSAHGRIFIYEGNYPDTSTLYLAQGSAGSPVNFGGMDRWQVPWANNWIDWPAGSPAWVGVNPTGADDPSGITEYVQFDASGEPTTGTGGSLYQTFTVLSPNLYTDSTIATTTATTSVEFSAQYFVGSTTPAAAGYDEVSTLWVLHLSRLDLASTTALLLASTGPLDATNTLTTTLTLPPNSAWNYYWSRLDIGGAPEQTESFTYRLNVLSDPIATLLGGSTSDTTGLATSTCTILNPTGCLQNALVFLFYPSTASLTAFTGLWTQVQHKPPFGYVTAVIGALNGLNDEASSTFTFPALPFMDTIFTPLYDGIAALLWLLFAVVFYFRLKHLDI